VLKLELWAVLSSNKVIASLRYQEDAGWQANCWFESLVGAHAGG